MESKRLISQKLAEKYKTDILEFQKRNIELKKLNTFAPTPIDFFKSVSTPFHPLRITACKIHLYEVEDEKAFLKFVEYLVIHNVGLLDVFYEVNLPGNRKILEINDKECFEFALRILVSFFGDALQILFCVIQYDVPVVEFVNPFEDKSNIDKFVDQQMVLSEYKLEEYKNRNIFRISLFGKSLGKEASWKICSPAKDFIRYELSLESDELEKLNHIEVSSFNVFFLQFMKSLNEIYSQKAFFLIISDLTTPLFKTLNHRKFQLFCRKVPNSVILNPFLLGSCKKKNFRLFWSFYSLCCLKYWSFNLPFEICIYNLNYFSSKNPFIISFSLKEFLSEAGLSNQGKNRKLAVTFFQNLESFVEIEALEHSAVETGYFPFSSLVLDFKMKRNIFGIYFEIELDPIKFFQVFNPSSSSSISYRASIWVDFLRYALQQGFTEKQLNSYMQSFFLFYAVLFQLSNTYFEAIPFLGLKHKVDPVSGNSRTCKKDRNRNKIYLSMVCFILEVYPSDIEILSYGKPILSHQELLSMVDIPFQEICLRNRY